MAEDDVVRDDRVGELLKLWSEMDRSQRKLLHCVAVKLSLDNGHELAELNAGGIDNATSLTSELDDYAEGWLDVEGAPVYPLDLPAVTWGDAVRPMRWLLEALESSEDCMPCYTCDWLDVPQGSTYAEGVRKLREAYAAHGAPSLLAEIPGLPVWKYQDAAG